MSENKAKVAITRRGSYSGESRIAISITDAASSLKVCEVEISLADFAECVTGLAGVEADFRLIANEYTAKRYGKNKVVERVHCEKQGFKDKKKMADYVALHFLTNYSQEWELWSDGTNSQQNGKDHEYIICKYV